MDVREARAADLPTLSEIYFRAVREGAARAYTRQQRAAWAPRPPDATSWRARLDGLETLVEHHEATLRGFMSWRRADGYLDLAFVLPEQQGTGVADRLYDALEARARASGCARLWSHASHLARPFLAKHGWQMLQAHAVVRQGVTLHNWVMEKDLT